MNEAELYILTNDLQFYNKLQELELLDKVSDFMTEFYKTSKNEIENEVQKRTVSLERDIDDLQSEIDDYDGTVTDLESEIDSLKAKILKL